MHVMPLGVPGILRSIMEQSVIDLLYDAKAALRDEGEVPRVICHLYSNNGAWSYAGLAKYHSFFPEKVVYDSSPWLQSAEDATSLSPFKYVRYTYILARVCTSIVLNRPEYEHIIITPALTAFLLPMVLLSDALLNVERKLHTLLRFNTDSAEQSAQSTWIISDLQALNDYLTNSQRPVPSLFIFSSGDKLLPMEHIHKYTVRLNQRRFQTYQYQFGDDVPHTSSFFVHPEVYTQVLDDFYHDRMKQY